MDALESKRQPTYSEQQAKEILAQAMALPDQEGEQFSRNQLAEMAAELGISADALQRAEQQWIRNQSVNKENASRDADMKLFLGERRADYRMHLSVFVIIHVFLILLNILTGGPLWFLYSLVGWGMALAIHTYVMLNETRGDRIESEFEEWRTKRLGQRNRPQLSA